MKKQSRLSLPLGLALVLGTSFLAAAAAPAPSPSTVKPSTKHHSLWKIDGPSATVWLLGSVHFLQETNYPLPKVIEAAFTNAEVVVFEIDLDEMENPAAQKKLLSKALLPAGETIEDHLSAKTYRELTNYLVGAGLPVAAFDRMQPGMAGIALTMIELQRLGMDPKYGLDWHFYKKAKREKKTIIALETVDFQIDMITGMVGEDGEDMMKSTLKDIHETPDKFGEMVKAWETGNAKQLEVLLNDALRDAPGVYNRLLINRNRSWIPEIEKLIGGRKNALVVVGAGHLVGKDSVVDLLQKKGYKVQQQ